MGKPEKLEELYRRRFDSVPERLQSEIGHFNVMELAPFLGKDAKKAPYRKRDYYKIMLTVGEARIEYADRVISMGKQALTFSNPLVPYRVSHNEVDWGYFCLFDVAFFRNSGDLQQYAVFQPGGTPVVTLSDEDVYRAESIFQKMLEEIHSDYIHKYDVLRNLVFELIHFAMKKQPASRIENQGVNANKRIALMFEELLERQFPLDDSHQTVKLRTPADFARQLNVHVNHLNRALKETTGKTTSEHINERKLQEARVLLKQSHWNISEIGYALGFKEPTHFSNFFKRHHQISPSSYRDQ